MRQPKFYPGQKVKAKDGQQVMTVENAVQAEIRQQMPKPFDIAPGKVIGHEYQGDIQCRWIDPHNNTTKYRVFTEDNLELVND
jgi:uncharacterized protein YodC (DUF2158 family)